MTDQEFVDSLKGRSAAEQIEKLLARVEIQLGDSTLTDRIDSLVDERAWDADSLGYAQGTGYDG